MQNRLLMKHVRNAIYSLSDPDTGHIRYVGQTVNLYNRTGRYLSPTVHVNSPHLENWLNKLRRENKHCEVHILELTETEADLDEAERRQIKRVKDMGFDLTNVMEGGNGKGSISDPAVLKAMAERSKLKWTDTAYRQKVITRKLEANAKQHGMTADEYDAHLQYERSTREERRILKDNKRMTKNAERQERKATVFYAVTHNGRAFIPLTNLDRFAVVSAEDADRVMSANWHANRTIKNGKTYWRPAVNANGGKTQLNRFVTDASEGQTVRHINGNLLDCTRGNLLVRPRGYRSNADASQNQTA